MISSSYRTYFICASYRSGSNLLCEILRRTGVAGSPDEYFTEPFLPDWFQRFEASSFDDYLPKVVEVSATKNQVFGAKLMGGKPFHDFINHCRQLSNLPNSAVTPAEVIAEVFPNVKYIWLTRRDKIRQAISFSKALQTNIWRSDSVEAETSKQEPVFNIQTINKCLLTLILQDAAWQEYFTMANTTPLTLVYEDFSQSPKKIIDRILEFLDISFPFNCTLGEEIKQKKLADIRSEKWVQWYLECIQHDLVNYHFENQDVTIGSQDNQIEQFVRERFAIINRLTVEHMVYTVPLKDIIKGICLKIAKRLGFHWLHNA